MARAVQTAVASPAVGGMIAADTPMVSIAVLSAAIAFHLAGCVLLLLGAPPLASMHAFAAFVVLTIVAASHQLVPVLLRVPPTPWMHTAVPAAGFACGFILLVAAFSGAPVFVAAGCVLAASAALWLGLLGSRIVRAAGERHSAVAMACALAAFGAAAWIGVWMAFDNAAGAAPAQRLAGMHGTLMIAAFASMLIVAISYRFVPMFALSHAGAYGIRSLQWVVFAGALIAALTGERAGFAIIAVGLLALAYQHGLSLRGRLRKRLDPSLVFGMTAWAFAIATAVVAGILGLQPGNAVALIVLGVLGWLSITIFGYGLKICGFLSWQLAKQRAPQAALAPLSTAIPLRTAYAALALLAAGAAVAAAGASQAGIAEQAGFALYAAGALCYVLTYARVALPYLLPERTVT